MRKQGAHLYQFGVESIVFVIFCSACGGLGNLGSSKLNGAGVKEQGSVAELPPLPPPSPPPSKKCVNFGPLSVTSINSGVEPLLKIDDTNLPALSQHVLIGVGARTLAESQMQQGAEVGHQRGLYFASAKMGITGEIDKATLYSKAIGNAQDQAKGDAWVEFSGSSNDIDLDGYVITGYGIATRNSGHNVGAIWIKGVKYVGTLLSATAPIECMYFQISKTKICKQGTVGLADKQAADDIVALDFAKIEAPLGYVMRPAIGISVPNFSPTQIWTKVSTLGFNKNCPD